MKLNTFVFSNNEDFDTGKMISATLKLNMSKDPEFNAGMMDGSSATAKMVSNKKFAPETYLKLFNYIRETYK